MSNAERQRLAAILGMLGSSSAGERDNAARLAEQFRKQHGLTWEQLVSGDTIYVDREIEIPIDRPILVPMPFAQSLVDCLIDIRTPPGFFIWTMIIIGLLDLLSRIAMRLG